MLTKAHPQQGGPREPRREKALHRAVTAPWACPAGEAQPGDPSRHHQHGQRHPVALAQGRCCHLGLEALSKCDNVHWGLPRRVRVEVVVAYNSRTTLRLKPCQTAYFGEGIAIKYYCWQCTLGVAVSRRRTLLTSYAVRDHDTAGANALAPCRARGSGSAMVKLAGRSAGVQSRCPRQPKHFSCFTER